MRIAQRFHTAAAAGLALVLAAAPHPATAADAATWQEANKRSAEAVRTKDYAAGADFGRQAFELYPAQAANYTAANHGQLLLNFVDALERSKGASAALFALHAGIDKVRKRAGPRELSLVSLWDEAIRLGGSLPGHPRVDDSYEASTSLLKQAVGPEDIRVLAREYRWVVDCAARHSSGWARDRLRDVRARAERSKDATTLLLPRIDVSLAIIDLALRGPKAALPQLQSAIAVLEKSDDGTLQASLQDAYAALEFACMKVRDEPCSNEAHARLIASFGGEDAPLVPLTREQPRYPAYAARDRVEGSVTMRVSVAPDGKVREASILTSTPAGVFDEATLTAIRQWTFQPRIVDGAPVGQTGFQTINYLMEPG